jgi:dienelactone hydrolase
MPDRFTRLPRSLASRTRWERLGPPEEGAGGGGIPAMLAHPDWRTPTPLVIWMHGRTAHKELDSGRYLRWLRAGMAACAIDLPGHGERADPAMQTEASTLRLTEQAVAEIDRVVASLGDARFGGAFDTARMGLGGMSAGGMVALRRLCDPHPFVCASVEATTGSFEHMPRYITWHGADLVGAMDPLRHISTWRPIPLLALHSEADQWVPVGGIRAFTQALVRHYAAAGADPALIALHTWESTGAPHEHLGFGRVSNDAKNMQTAFFLRHLGPGVPANLE